MYEGQEVYFEQALPIRVKVRNVRFPPLPTPAQQAEQREAGEEPVGTKARPYAPMQVRGGEGVHAGTLGAGWGMRVSVVHLGTLAPTRMPPCCSSRAAADHCTRGW